SEAAGSEQQENTPAPSSELVVIAHSNRVVRRRLSRTLSAVYQTLEADDAAKTVEAIQGQPVSLVILDSEIKGASGTGICKQLKESQQGRHIPVIMVAPETDPNGKVAGLNAGADDCISDTCVDAELLARVRSSMRLRKTEQELSTQLQLLEDYAQRLEH